MQFIGLSSLLILVVLIAFTIGLIKNGDVERYHLSDTLIGLYLTIIGIGGVAFLIRSLIEKRTENTSR